MALVAMMVTRTAVPIDPAIWRNVLFIAVPCGISSLGNWFKAKVVIGIMTIAMKSFVCRSWLPDRRNSYLGINPRTQTWARIIVIDRSEQAIFLQIYQINNR